MTTTSSVSVLHVAAVLALGACSGSDDRGRPATDASTVPQLTGVYTCSIETIDDRNACGGPVYTTDLRGDAVTMTVTQEAEMLEVGMWGKILTGTVDADGQVSLLYRDITCTTCSGQRPFLITVEGVAGDDQLANLAIRMYQVGVGECEKTYRGTCATNGS